MPHPFKTRDTGAGTLLLDEEIDTLKPDGEEETPLFPRRVSKNDKIALIRSVPLFARCSKKELGEIASLADEIDLPENKSLIRQGERGREFFVLMEGEVEVEPPAGAKIARPARAVHCGPRACTTSAQKGSFRVEATGVRSARSYTFRVKEWCVVGGVRKALPVRRVTVTPTRA